MQKKSLTEKISLLASGFSVLYFAHNEQAQANIIYVGNKPLTISMQSNFGLVNWDLDGNGVNDFALVHSGLTGFGALSIDNNTPLAGSAFVNKTNQQTLAIENLANGVVVGATLTNNYAFGNRASHLMVGAASSGVVGFSSLGLEGFSSGTNGHIGFKFTSNSQTHYGWATLYPSSTGLTSYVTIKNWAYNDSPNAPITVGDTGGTAVPFDFNPLQGMALGVPIFMGLRQLKRRKAKQNTIASIKGKEKIHPLALLGMGAGGVRKWREQKDKGAA